MRKGTYLVIMAICSGLFVLVCWWWLLQPDQRWAMAPWHWQIVALQCAISRGEHGRVAEMIKCRPSVVSTSDCYGNAPLLLAAKCSNARMVSLFLEYGADANCVDAVGGRTPLHWAAARDDAAMAKALLERGAVIEAADVTGQTPLCVATASGSRRGAANLVAVGAALSASDLALLP